MVIDQNRSVGGNPFFQKLRVFCLVFIILLAILPVAARKAFPAQTRQAQMYEKAKSSYNRLKKNPKKQNFRHNWLNTIDLYRIVFEKYPDSPEAEKAMYMVGQLYRKLFYKSWVTTDLDMSIYYFRRLVKTYNESRFADDGQYLIGEILLEDKKDGQKAFIEFEKVVDNYPKGDMHKKALSMLKKLSRYRPENTPAECPSPVITGKGEPARAVSLRHWSNPSYTRVVVDVDKPVRYNHNFLKVSPESNNPPRLYIDLFNTTLSAKLAKPITISDGLLMRARAGQFTADTVRVVLDMARINDYRVFSLNDPFRIVVDVSGNGPRTLQLSGGSQSIKTPVDQSLTLAQQLGLGVGRVVIDPGHGGRDPGAVGLNNIKEKDITLDTGLRLRDILTKQYGLDVVMTRSTDKYLPLEERTAIANTNRADLFISIHCNSSRKNRLKGIETYFLNFASSKEAAETAARENMTSLARIADCEKTVVDLIMTMKVDESSRFARILQDELCRYLKKDYKDITNLGVKQAPFVVLIGAQMPSVLSEISFINHPVEGKRLGQKHYRQGVAEAMARGISKYVKTVNIVSSK